MSTDQTVHQLRTTGHSVIFFLPEDLKGIDLYYFEEELVSAGWRIIDGMRQEGGGNDQAHDD